MRKQWSALVILFILSVFFSVSLSGCQEKFNIATVVEVAPSAKIQQYSKVIVIGISSRLDIRRMEEDAVCQELKNTECIKSLSFMSFSKSNVLSKAVDKMEEVSANAILLVNSEMRNRQYSEKAEDKSLFNDSDEFYLTYEINAIDSDKDSTVEVFSSTTNKHKDYPQTLKVMTHQSISALRDKGFFKK